MPSRKLYDHTDAREKLSYSLLSLVIGGFFINKLSREGFQNDIYCCKYGLKNTSVLTKRNIHFVLGVLNNLYNIGAPNIFAQQSVHGLFTISFLSGKIKNDFISKTVFISKAYSTQTKLYLFEPNSSNKNNLSFSCPLTKSCCCLRMYLFVRIYLPVITIKLIMR